MDESLNDITGIDMIRAYIQSPHADSFESRLSKEEKEEAYSRAYSIWLSRMNKQLE